MRRHLCGFDMTAPRDWSTVDARSTLIGRHMKWMAIGQNLKIEVESGNERQQRQKKQKNGPPMRDSVIYFA